MEQTEQALMKVLQLPVIDAEANLLRVKAEVERDVELALSLPCTEETKVEVKRVRAKLTKTKTAYEEQRKAVKEAILAPYEAFNAVYKECITTPLEEADAKLAKKIAAVEDEVKRKLTESVAEYFSELVEAADVDLSFLTFAHTGIRVGVSDTLKSLKDAARIFVERVTGEVKTIALQEHADEIMVEYKATLNLGTAVITVSARHKKIEEERQRKAAQEAARIEQEQKAQNVIEVAKSSAALDVGPKVIFPTATHDEYSEPPVAAVSNDLTTEAIFTVKLRVTANREKLVALKNFLTEGEYTYEQYAE